MHRVLPLANDAPDESNARAQSARGGTAAPTGFENQRLTVPGSRHVTTHVGERGRRLSLDEALSVRTPSLSVRFARREHGSDSVRSPRDTNTAAFADVSKAAAVFSSADQRDATAWPASGASFCAGSSGLST